VVAPIHDPRCIGVHRYVERLSAALAPFGVDYEPMSRPAPHAACHFHLANSTRAVIPRAAHQRRWFLLTVHDVIPRSQALRPVHRAVLLLLSPTAAEIRAGIEALLDDGELRCGARVPCDRAAELTWEAAARVHAELLEEVAGA